jgi:hypothetical protein
MQPLPARDVLDRYFLEARSKLLDLAAILDRLDRGGGLSDDPRLQQLLQATTILQEKTSAADRAEKLQLLFSRQYDPAWRKG